MRHVSIVIIVHLGRITTTRNSTIDRAFKSILAMENILAAFLGWL
jgi:hypothetical protein